MFDLTDMSTFQHVDSWIKHVSVSSYSYLGVRCYVMDACVVLQGMTTHVRHVWSVYTG